MTNFLKGLFSFFLPRPKMQPEELQDAFRRHYRNFRALLTANNNALELMAEMEQMQTSGRSFGMAFVRGHCTALSVNVFKMVEHLTRLADGRYSDLRPVFQSVARQIEEVLGRQPNVVPGRHILSMDEIDKSVVDQVGEKMANLGEVRNRVGLRTPDGFAITAAAAKYFIDASNLQAEISRRLKTLDMDNLEELYTVSAAIQSLIARAELPEELEREIAAEYRKLAEAAGKEVLVSMRSSALGEDSMNVSFAGQYRTQLNVEPEFLGQTYKEIVAGKYKGQAIVYRQQRGYRHQDVLMCVGCLAMVEAVISGVSYSRSPDDPRSSWVVIQAAAGLASQVVDGRATGETLCVDRAGPNATLSRNSASGEISAGGAAPLVLTDEQAAKLAQVAISLEAHFGAPQDVEWSIDHAGELYILQTRPIGENVIPLPVKENGIFAASDLPRPFLAGGSTASKGISSGTVFKVASSLELLQFPRNAVLVVETPYPDWASVLSRAAAVISNSGQIAAHLATVAREFGVPALFGVEQAYETLENGDEVTVDATARKVYKGRVEQLLALSSPKPDLMAGSPVARILKEVLAHVTPLNLTDPASPFFRPSSCTTLHDITRFCHEKAVVEMFSFGERAGFADKAAKQLVVDAPFQWWVINLDDGFRPGVDLKSRFIHIDDIVSEPMLAIWQGMTAVPWDGPPPISLRGFGSIVFQSTMNPRLDPGVRSTMGARNYFLVSKKFCNVSVRLGYHFAMVEANLSELLTESYISFQFKGGAADERRRCQRINILRDFLEQIQFRTEQKGDALNARLEKHSVDYLRERLTVLGYLLIHTRQIDMIMGDDDAVDRFLAKISTDIEMIRAGLQPKEEADGNTISNIAGR